MADANQLKIEARRKEAGGDYGAASRLYQRALSTMEEKDSLPDPSLLVRVADLEYRQDDPAMALDYYRRAVDDYAEQGLITNAIAVCNKILRVFPEQIGCYRRLADLHMDVGLVAEARQNLLKFVDQAWDEGATDPAIEAMEELLARSPDQEIALKMATCLARLDREEDALEVLARVWRERRKADADVEALERKARSLDPDVELDAWPGAAGEDDGAPIDAPDTGAGEGPPPSPLDELAAAADSLADADAGEDDEEATDEAPDGGGREPRRVPYVPPDELPGRDGPTGRPRPAAGGTNGSGGGSRPPAGNRPLAGDRDLAAGGAGERPSAPATGASTVASRLPAPGEEERGLELVASFPEWFMEIGATRPSNGANGSSAARRAVPAGEPTTADTRPADPAKVPAARGTDETGEAPPDTKAWEERAMEELDRLDRLEARSGATDADDRAGGGVTDADERAGDGPAPDTGATPPETGPPAPETGATSREMGATSRETGAPPPDPGPGAPASGAEPGGHSGVEPEADREPDRTPETGAAGGAGGGPEAPGGSPESRPAGRGEELGEEVELRRGLELLDDLLEVDPDNTELQERKVRYARRLGDREALVSALLDLADGMAEKKSRRGARLLYDRVLALDEGNPRAEAGLERLDRGELEQKRQSGKRAGAAASPPSPVPEEKEARRQLGMRLWTEFEKAVQEMPWLHAATQTYQATGPEAAPPMEAFEMLAHYLISRDRCREAAEILEQAVRVADRSDDEIADALYYLGVAHERLGESGKAADYFRRLEAVDPEFASVRDWLPDEEGRSSA